jgi:hypothetical protein
LNYYRVLKDRDVANLCFFGEPVGSSGEVDARRFTRCEIYAAHDETLRIPILKYGEQPDFAYGAFDLPVVSPSLGRRLQEFAPESVELIPAVADEVERKILNVLACVDAIDEQRTVGEKWPSDTLREDRAGQYRTIVHLFLDVSRLGGHHVFRVGGWQVALVISETLAKQLSADEMNGVRLVPVT